MRSTLFHAVAWVAARHLQHFEANKALSASIGAWLMQKICPEYFEHSAEVLEQGEELHELNIMSAALEIKSIAMEDGGWDDSHAVGLDMLAQLLIERHDWDFEDVNDWLERLTEGVFSFALEDEE